MKMIDGIPRRSRLDLHTPAEAAIRAAVNAVEASGGHPLLTDAVNLLLAAADKVADFVEMPLEHEVVYASNAPEIFPGTLDALGKLGA